MEEKFSETKEQLFVLPPPPIYYPLHDVSAAPFDREKADMGREDYRLVPGSELTPGMHVLDIGGRAKEGSERGVAPEGVGVVEDIMEIRPASPSGGREYVDLHLRWVRKGTKRWRYAYKTKRFQASPTA